MSGIGYDAVGQGLIYPTIRTLALLALVLVLQRFFRMSIEDATRVMLQVHQKGVGVCGVFTYEVAETKVSQVIDFARQNQHPLQCTLEKA